MAKIEDELLTATVASKEVSKNKIQNALNKYCDGICMGCRFDDVCSYLDDEDEINLDGLIEAWKKAITPTKDEGTILDYYLSSKGLAEQSELVGNHPEANCYTDIATGVKIAYSAISGIHIDYNDGNVVERYTGIDRKSVV